MWGVGLSAQGQPPVLTDQVSGVTALLQAVSAPGARIVWASGHRGTVVRTTDGGATWRRLTVPGSDTTLEFRDVHALDSLTAWVLAAGPGERSRIYGTRDGGQTWTRQFQNADSLAFYDCFAFWSARRAVAFSDGLILLTTSDGANWSFAPPGTLPAAQKGEGAFAASGTCVVTMGTQHGWIGTGAADTARVLRTADGGRTWSVAVLPIPGGEAAGSATVAFRDTLRGAALGGNLAAPEDSVTVNVALTADGGRTWRAAGRTPFVGGAYGSAFVPGTSGLVAVGPKGMGWSPDGGTTWAKIDARSFWSVGFAPTGGVGWAVGPRGTIVRIAAN